MHAILILYQSQCFITNIYLLCTNICLLNLLSIICHFIKSIKEINFLLIYFFKNISLIESNFNWRRRTYIKC